METVNRRATYRLYPTPAQEAALEAQREAHRLLYNAALEQRVRPGSASGSAWGMPSSARI